MFTFGRISPRLRHVSIEDERGAAREGAGRTGVAVGGEVGSTGGRPATARTPLVRLIARTARSQRHRTYRAADVRAPSAPRLRLARGPNEPLLNQTPFLLTLCRCALALNFRGWIFMHPVYFTYAIASRLHLTYLWFFHSFKTKIFTYVATITKV